MSRDDRRVDQQDQPEDSRGNRRPCGPQNGVPTTVTSIPLVDPNAMPPNPSIGDLVKGSHGSGLNTGAGRSRTGQGRDHPRREEGMTGSIFFILALVVLFCSTFFFFFFLAELLDIWVWRWVAFGIVFAIMVAVTAVLALLGYLKVRRSRPSGPSDPSKGSQRAFTRA